MSTGGINKDGNSLEDILYFGGCPECGKTNGYLNVNRDHWNVCDEHKIKWYLGSNLFSSWKEENEEQWESNKKRLEEYRAVEPIRATNTIDPSSKLKKKLLEHYSTRSPQPFIQFDCFVNEKGDDDIVKPDKDGDCLFSGTTYELMTGAYGIRVLVRPDVEKKAIIRILSKIITWLLREDETDDVLLDAKRELERGKNPRVGTPDNDDFFN